jgi:hypothetical protein
MFIHSHVICCLLGPVAASDRLNRWSQDQIICVFLTIASDLHLHSPICVHDMRRKNFTSYFASVCS